MSTERSDWVEIVEPRTQEHMYANLATGECVWDPPSGVKIKKADDKQWWELFDQNTSRFYYYNASTQKTVWHRPQNSNIIPLAKLQTLNQNTEACDDSEIKRESVATQTVTKDNSVSGNIDKLNRPHTVCVSTQTSPHSSPLECRKHYRHHHHKNVSSSSSPAVLLNHYVPTKDTMQIQRYKYSSSNSQHQQLCSLHDSGRSSDSSIISQGQAFCTDVNHHGHRKNDSFCSSRSGSSSHSHGPNFHSRQSSINDEKNLKIQISEQTIAGNTNHLNKPIMLTDLAPQWKRSFEISPSPNLSSWRQVSADSSFGINRNLSRPLTSNRGRKSILGIQSVESTPRPYRKWQKENISPSAQDLLRYTDHPPSHLDTDVSNRYLPAGLCTPLSNRKQWLQTESRSTDSSTSSPQSPLVCGVGDTSSLNIIGEHHSHNSSNSSPLSIDSFAQGTDSGQVTYDSNMSLDYHHKNSNIDPVVSPSFNDFNFTSSPIVERCVDLKLGHRRDGSKMPYINRDAQKCNSATDHARNMTNLNERTIPTYGNMEYQNWWGFKTDNQSHLLPLQQYLLEQAKLSGFKLTDFIGYDRDSLSQSDEDSEGCREEEDDFADDEGMSYPDSSSQEYLDEYKFLEEDEYNETAFYASLTPQIQQKNQLCHKTSESMDFGESDASSLFSTSSPILPLRSSHAPIVPSQSFAINTQHASLRRRHTGMLSHSPALEKSQSFQPDMGPPPALRPLSMVTSTTTDGNIITNSVPSRLQQQATNTITSVLFKDNKPPSVGDIEKYAEDNLNRHKRGIFRKKITIQDMLSWSKDAIRKPMIMTTDKSLKREACELFKLIQVHMGDRKAKSGDNPVLDIAIKGWSKQTLRDELYIQICRQITDNPRRESLLLGWELMAICLSFFPPSLKFYPYLEGFIKRHKDVHVSISDAKITHYATVCGKRLERIAPKGRNRNLRKPTVDDVDQSKIQIFRPSMFGSTLQEVLSLQSSRYPQLRLPWIQTTLSEAVLESHGAQTEGIFRVPGDIDEVNALKLRMDHWDKTIDCNDPHVPASLLKLWYRELHEPLIPDEHYDECIQCCNEPEAAVLIVQKLPEINHLVFSYLIRFLQVFAAEENALVTKMDSNNLAMVMAPNCLRCKSEDPKIIFENTRKEMAFIRSLIQHLDTSYMEGIL